MTVFAIWCPAFRFNFFMIRITLVLVLLLFSFAASAQAVREKDAVIARLNINQTLPDNLLSTRAVVLYDEPISEKDLQEIQQAFQQTGIDAVAYFVTDLIMAGPDAAAASSVYLTSRGIGVLIFLDKTGGKYSLTFTKFNNKSTFADDQAPAWKESDVSLNELLKTVFRFAVSNQKKQNLLISDFPETSLRIKYFTGRRSEAFTAMTKSFKVAVPKFSDEKANAVLEQMLKENFPVKYEMTDPTWDDRELNRRGFTLVLRFVHTQGTYAKQILDYDLSQMASSIASTDYTSSEPQVKTFHANQTVYKFYIRHIEYGNIFLGLKWDADPAWQTALLSHLKAMRADLNF